MAIGANAKSAYAAIMNDGEAPGRNRDNRCLLDDQILRIVSQNGDP